MNIIVYGLTVYFVIAVAAPLQKQMQRSSTSAGCISKYYNKDLGPLEILMMPLGEKLWLRAWLGMHMSNLLHMEGVDLAEVSQTQTDRDKRDISQMFDMEYESKVRRNLFENVAPYSYRLLFKPLVTEALFYGEIHINITCLHPTNSIVLHASSHLKVIELVIRRLDYANITDIDSSQNEQERQARDHIDISKIVWIDKASLCEILLQETLTKGAQYEIHFKYQGPISDKNDGIIFHRYQHSGFSELSWFLGTNLKHENAMKVFPCFYGSKYKAIFEIIVVHSVDMVSVTSSPLIKTELISDTPGWMQSYFKITPPMTPSSLAVFVLYPQHFDQTALTTDSGLIINGFVWKNDSHEIQDILDYLSSGVVFLEERLGVPFPPPQLTILFMLNNSNTADDFWGLILTGSDVSPAALLFHLLKQWFGHFVTATRANEEFVTRSLAYYYAYFCSLDLQDGCEAGSKLLVASHTDYIALQDVKETMATEDFKDHKMVLFLRMLNFSLSEESFQRGIQVFLKYRSYSTFVEEDLWDALDIQAWSDGTLDRTLSTKDISGIWLSHDMQPLVILHTNHGNSTLVIEQQVFVRHWPYTVRGQKNILWQIPVSFITESDLMEGRPGITVWVKEKSTIIHMNVYNFGEYYIANYNNIGMYMVNYDNDNWKVLSESLLIDGMNQHFLIPAKTRASLLRNAWYLAVTGHLDFTVALNMTLFLKYETDLSLWKTFGEIYFMVSWKLIGTGVEIKFDRFVGDLFIPLYESASINRSHISDDVEALAYYVLCKAGYEPAIQNAKLEFDQWLIHHHEINHGVVSGVLRWIDEDWERGLDHVLDLLKDNKFPKIRSFLLTQLAGSPNQEKTERLLSVLLIDPAQIFSKAEIMNVLPAVSSCKTFLEFLTSEWKAVKERFESEPNMWQFILEQATKKCKTRDGITRVETFYKSHQTDLGISGNSLKHNIEVARRNMEVVYYQIPELEDALNHFL